MTAWRVGTELPSATFTIQRHNLIHYCGASGDSNVIHWNERVATAVGLPNVISHGMFTMAEAGRVRHRLGSATPAGWSWNTPCGSPSPSSYPTMTSAPC